MKEVLIFSGPHGSGKDTILNEYIELNNNAKKIIRYITRPKDINEKDGNDYYFVNNYEFSEMVSNEEFIEFSYYEDGSSGTKLVDVYTALENSDKACLSINFEDSLLLHNSLNHLNINNRILFVIPCLKKDMFNNRDYYLSELARRMISRNRTSDDIVSRLNKAEEYLNLSLETTIEIIYIENISNKITDTMNQINNLVNNIY